MRKAYEMRCGIVPLCVCGLSLFASSRWHCELLAPPESVLDGMDLPALGA
jgi:hypothetical protein